MLPAFPFHDGFFKMDFEAMSVWEPSDEERDAITKLVKSEIGTLIRTKFTDREILLISSSTAVMADVWPDCQLYQVAGAFVRRLKLMNLSVNPVIENEYYLLTVYYNRKSVYYRTNIKLDIIEAHYIQSFYRNRTRYGKVIMNLGEFIEFIEVVSRFVRNVSGFEDMYRVAQRQKLDDEPEDRQGQIPF
jgi:hypothetical protein